MSFGVGIGDIILVSSLAYKLGKTLTSGRKEAPEEFQRVQNQLFAISNALKLLSSTLEKTNPEDADPEVIAEEDDILSRMVENCEVTLNHLSKVLESYPELQEHPTKEKVGDSKHRQWKQDLKDNIKNIKWTTEGAGLDKLRQNLGTHLNALNLAIAARSCFQTDQIKAQVDSVHGMLGDIYEWYLSNMKNAPKKPAQAKVVSSSAAEPKYTLEQQHDRREITFSIFLEESNKTPLTLCAKATFSPEWLKAEGGRLFRCVCGYNHELDYTLMPVSLLLRLATPQPTWKIHAFSKQHNSVASLLVLNVPCSYLADFEQNIYQLALIQGLRSVSAGRNSMLMYTSIQEDKRGSLSVLNTIGETAHFRDEFSNVAVTSNGLRFELGAIDSVQMLHYMVILFPGPAATDQENKGLLSSQSAEIVLHKAPLRISNDSDITQLVVEFDHLTVIDRLKSAAGVTLSNIKVKASFENDDHHNIQEADIEIAFTSHAAAEACLSSIKALQRQLFLSYLQSPRLGENVQLRRTIGDVMIRDMQLLDAHATVVENTSTKEQRLIIKSHCGSKYVTMILPKAPSDALLLQGSRGGLDLPAFFVDVSTQGVKIIEQTAEVTAILGLPQGGKMDLVMRDA